MKKLVSLATVVILGIAVFAPVRKADAQVYGSYCCDIGEYNEPRVRCAIWPPAPVGVDCVCPGIYGVGFVCH